MDVIYHEIKLFIDNISFIPRDIIHVYGGVCTYLGWLILFKSRKQVLCLAIIFLLALANEALDIIYYLDKINIIHWKESLSDTFNTIFLPIVLFFFFKLRISYQ